MATAPAILPVIPETLDRRLTVEQIRARRQAIREVMKKEMKENVHYGTIPGTPKPTLYKPGAEILCALFQLAPRIHVHDMSSPDSVRYQVKVEMYSSSGIFCGEGIGTASSNETKYQWRVMVCQEEYDAALDDERRVAYKRDRYGEAYSILQIRTEPEDADNTILKMAKKRALIDAVLTVTAASDIFTQDIETDEPGEPGDLGSYGKSAQQTQPTQPTPQRQQTSAQPTQRTSPPPPSTPPPSTPPQRGIVISDAQSKRFFAIATKAGKNIDDIHHYMHNRFGLEHSRDLRREDYDEACLWAAGVGMPSEEQLEPSDADEDARPF